MDLCHDTDLLPLFCAGREDIFPDKIDYSALLESGYSSTGAVATDCTIALGFKPTAATIAPLNDMAGHYLLTIQKQGATVKVWKQGVQLADYIGNIGSSYADFLSNVLTAYCGSDHGYYSRLVVVEQVLTYSDFWGPSDLVTGLWVPKELTIPNATKSVLIPQSSGTIIGNFNTRVSAAFDGNTNQSLTIVALCSSYDAYIGKDYGAGNEKVITQAKIWGSKDQGYNYGGGVASTDFYLQASNDGTNWTTLASKLGVAEVANANPQTLVSNDTSTTWRYVRFHLVYSISSGDTRVAEVQFFSTEEYTYGTGGGLYEFGNAIDIGSDTSGNGNDWTLAGTQSDDTPTDNTTTREWAEPTILKSSTVADIVLRQGMAGVQQFVGGIPSASSTWPGGNPYGTGYTVEGGFTESCTAFADVWMSNEVGAGTLMYDFGEGNTKVLSSFGVRAANINDTVWAYAPKDFVIEGSFDNVSWIPVFSKTGESFTASNQLKTYDAGNTTAYRSYRLRVTATVNNLNTQIGCFYGCVDTKVILPDMTGGPDFVDIKNRDSAYNWVLTDSVRGATKTLYTNKDVAQGAWTSGLSAFNSDGYNLETGGPFNAANNRFVDLCLKAGPKQGFAIVPFTGGGVAGQQIAHDLGKAPTCMIVKRVSDVSDWAVYHAALGATKALKVNAPDAVVANANYWNNAEPTATHFTVGGWFVGNGSSYIAYLFTDSDIFKAFSYLGNGLAEGPFVTLGGKVLSIPFWKNSADGAAQWLSLDGMRDQSNPAYKTLFPNLPNSEYFNNTLEIFSQFLPLRGLRWLITIFRQTVKVTYMSASPFLNQPNIQTHFKGDLIMFRYSNGQFRVNPPATVVDIDGFRRNFVDLTREELDALGCNEAVPVERKPFTTYETEWQKGEDLIYREAIVSATVDEAARAEAEAVEVRAERDRRLRACDWTVLPDCPLTEVKKTEWADYRQALRDVPQQSGFPDAVEWPISVETD